MSFEAGKSSDRPEEAAEHTGSLSRDKGSNKKELPRVLRCLFDEHRHLNALMRALERKARQKGRLVAGDYYLLRDIVGYLHDYPDSVHHPTENLLFEILLRREPGKRQAVAGLRRDHKSVAVETQDLLDLLDQAIDEPGKEVERSVRQSCLDFSAHQRKHMQFENQKLFPAAIEALSQADWKQIEAHFAAVEDPLFGRVVGNSHRLLYEYLVHPASKATESFSVSRLFSLERLIMMVDVLEKGSGSWCARLKDLGENVTEETRAAVARSLKPESLVSAITLPAKYAAFLGKSMLDCSGDLSRISTTTAKDALALYTRPDPFD
jgi:hemerythrin-like domain-containing protein